MNRSAIWTWRIVFLLVFLGWIFIWILLPTKTYKNSWTPKLNEMLNSTYFREQGMHGNTNLWLIYSVFFFFKVSSGGCSKSYEILLFCRKKSSVVCFPNHARCCFRLCLSPLLLEIKNIIPKTTVCSFSISLILYNS